MVDLGTRSGEKGTNVGPILQEETTRFADVLNIRSVREKQESRIIPSFW